MCIINYEEVFPQSCYGNEEQIIKAFNFLVSHSKLLVAFKLDLI